MQLALKHCPFGLGAAGAALLAAFSGCSSEREGDPRTNDGGAGFAGTAASGGWSGSAGTGGSGGESGAGAAGGVDAGGVDIEGAEWLLVPGSEFTGPNCSYYEAKPGTLTFSPLKWTPCGAGCDTADPLQGYTVTEAAAVSASIKGGQAYLQFGIILKGTPWSTDVMRIVRLTDGSTAGAWMTRENPVGGVAACVFSQDRESATAVDFSGPSPQHLDLFGFALTGTDNRWTWAQPAMPLAKLPAAKSAFHTDDATFYVGEGGVFGLLHAEQGSNWTTLESPSDSMYGGGDGDLAVWTEWNSDRVRAWAPDGKGVRTLLDTAPSKTCLIKPSATHIVGMAQASDCTNAYPTSVRLWHMPRSYDLTASVVTTPVLATNVEPSPVEIRTWGDYAGVLLFDQTDAQPTSTAGWILVVRLSTGQAWRIEAEPGMVLQEASWVFDDTWLYFGETLPGASYSRKLTKLRRIELSNLDAWGKTP